MIMQRSERAVRDELSKVEHHLANLTKYMAEVEGHRDRLIAELSDEDGAHDSRQTYGR